VRDGETLFATKRYDACYYLAGYAVECALKACIARKFRANTIPDRNEVNRTYSHDLARLVEVAGLQVELERRLDNAGFGENWNLVKDWRPDRRYELATTRGEARALLEAITDPQNGILVWLSKHW